MAALTNLSNSTLTTLPREGYAGGRLAHSVKWGVCVLHDVPVTRLKMQWTVSASSKRELADLQYEDRQNKEDYNNRQKKGRICERQTSFHYTDCLSMPTMYLPAQSLPKELKSLCILKKKKKTIVLMIQWAQIIKFS